MKFKIVSGIMLTLLLVGILGMAFHFAPVSGIPAPSGEGVLWVEPDYVNGSLGVTFTVELWANISTMAGVPGFEGCFAYAYWFSWNDTLLEIQLYSVYPPEDIWTTGIFTVEDTLKDIDANTKIDSHSYSVTALGFPPGWKDARKIAEYTFKFVYEPVSPGSTASSALDITNKGFADADEEEITMTVYDGYFEYTPSEHDIAVFLEAPRCIIPGDSVLLNATVLNGGLNNETDVELQLLVDDVIKNSTLIDSLQVGTSHSISYTLTTPSVETICNVTAYALPVSNEDYTLNNMESKRVLVSYVIKVPFHYPTIQEAILAANPGNTILVSAGTYYEYLTIDRSLKLVGEESSPPMHACIDGNGGGHVIRVIADKVDISGFTIQNGLFGITLADSDNSIISGNIVSNSEVGIYLIGSDNNAISSNTVSDNSGAGIVLGGSDNSTISGNTVSNNYEGGIYLAGSDNSTISGNTLSHDGIQLYRSNNTVISGNTLSYGGIGLGISSNNTVEDNMIAHAHTAIYLYGYLNVSGVILPGCNNNSISSNTVSDSGIGIYANTTMNNVIYHNSFINNTEQVLLDNSSDIWDNGCEGNYWRDYNGTDLDGDGVGDEYLPWEGVDYFPLMSPYIEGDVNHDALVDVYDLRRVAKIYLCEHDDPNWNPHADLVPDNIINILDLRVAAKNFGKTWSP